MITLERDTHGRTYQVWQQQQQNSCGIACCWMARSIAMQMSFAPDEWDYAVTTFASAVGGTIANLGVDASGPMSLDPSAFPVTAGDPSTQSSLAHGMASYGFYGSQLASALRADGLTVEDYGDNGNPIKVIHNKIAYNKPAIALVQWLGGGGHFVVVGRCTSKEITFCDPWDGRIKQYDNNSWYVPNYDNIGRIVEVIYVRA